MPELAFDLAWLGAREESRVDENLLSAGRRSAAERIAALILILYRRAEALALTEDHTFSFPLSACSPNTSSIARDSFPSPAGVDVACAFT